jgi:hypothetical protein
MNKETLNRQFDKATKLGQETIAHSPKAKKVSYNSRTKRLTVELESGVAAVIPASLVQIFEGVADEQIKDVEIAVQGLYLRWKSLDEDLFVPNLLQGIFGTRRWMDNLQEHLSNAGKKGGASRSDAKRVASAENGRKGGRPKKRAAA